jgi:hypothetical protein
VDEDQVDIPVATATSASLSDDDGEDFQIRLTLPSSARGHDISVVLSPRKKTQGPTTRSTPTPTPCTLPSSASVADDTVADDPFAVAPAPAPAPAPVLPQIGVHLRPDRVDLPIETRWAVPQDVRTSHPPLANSCGWIDVKWYVVWRGKEVGIFRDLWYEIISSSFSFSHPYIGLAFSLSSRTLTVSSTQVQAIKAPRALQMPSSSGIRTATKPTS